MYLYKNWQRTIALPQPVEKVTPKGSFFA